MIKRITFERNIPNEDVKKEIGIDLTKGTTVNQMKQLDVDTLFPFLGVKEVGCDVVIDDKTLKDKDMTRFIITYFVNDVNQASKNIINHINQEVIDEFKSNIEEFFSREKLNEEDLNSFHQDTLEYAKGAISYLLDNNITNWEELRKFSDKFGGTPLIDIVLEDIYGLGWEEKTGAFGGVIG